MKTLKEFIFENFNYVDIGEQYISLNNYYQDALNEVLIQSYNVEKLVNKLKSTFDLTDDDIIVSNYNTDFKNFKILYNKYKKITNSKETYENFIKIIASYGYYFSNCIDGYANIEPVFSENVTHIVQDDCHGKLYKIINKKTMNSIKLRHGLIIDKDKIFDIVKNEYKNGKYKNLSKDIKTKINNIINKQDDFPFRINQTQLRQWSSRLFFFAVKNKNGLKDAINIIDSQLNISDDEWYIVEIDISKYNVNCYRDCYSESNNDNYVLLYVNAFFPEKLLKIYSKQEFYELHKL